MIHAAQNIVGAVRISDQGIDDKSLAEALNVKLETFNQLLSAYEH
jgi:hypothetical protein